MPLDPINMKDIPTINMINVEIKGSVAMVSLLLFTRP